MKTWRGLVLIAAAMLGACAVPSTLDHSGTSAPTTNEKTIFVIRHLHKAQGDDPPLNKEGAAAAERLADMLEDEGILATFATPTRRARETAAPLSNRIDVAITEYDARNPEALVASVSAIDGSVLVVGHSNTVPDLVERFGGYPAPRLTEDDYGTIFAIDPMGNVEELPVD